MVTLELQTEKEKSMEDYQLLVDLHKYANRQGQAGMPRQKGPQSGHDRSGCATKGCRYRLRHRSFHLLLARLLNAQITAVDFLQVFLEVLESRAESIGLSEKLHRFAVQWTIYPLKMRNLILSGLKVQYTISALKGGNRLVSLPESWWTTDRFGDYLDYIIPSIGTPKTLGG